MLDTNAIAQFATLLRNATRIAVLSGAGMSTESGIPDFRSNTGIYKTLCNEEIFDLERFERRPQDFYQIIAPFYGKMRDAAPNAGHLALARLENEFGKHVAIATQNIDGLHQRGGSQDVQEVHGSMMTLSCRDCGQSLPVSALEDVLRSGRVLRHSDAGSSCHGILKPDIVFYGEMLPENAVDNACQAMRHAELVLVLGTSLAVYPAASFPTLRPRHSQLVIINRTPTPLDNEATLVFRDDIGTVLSAAVEQLAN